ncbi:S24 family peptidase [Aeromonas jandaei]|nr:S24 family peptidase [Aeromonas jandaei]
MKILNGTAFDLEAFSSRMKQLVGRETYSSFGRRVGVSDAVVRKYCLGETMPSVALVSQIAGHDPALFVWLCMGIGEVPEQLATSPISKLAATDAGDQGHDNSSLKDAQASYSTNAEEITLVDSYHVFASAGHGAVIADELKLPPEPFRTDELKGDGLKPERLAIIRAKGDSMEPTISNNEKILISLCNGESLRDGIYVLRIGDSLLVKRLQFDPFGGFKIISDNPVYGEQAVTKEQRQDVHIVGRVVRVGKKF